MVAALARLPESESLAQAATVMVPGTMPVTVTGGGRRRLRPGPRNCGTPPGPAKRSSDDNRIHQSDHDKHYSSNAPNLELNRESDQVVVSVSPAGSQGWKLR
jgi:hypothetical protein